MHNKKIIFWFVVIIFWCDGQNADIVEQIRDSRQERYASGKNDGVSKSSFSLLSDTISQVSHESDNCNDDIACLLTASSDRLGLEAIKALHQQLDDDANGNVDLSESDDFLREELKYDSGYEKRQRAFHFNDDMHISVRELWEAWLKSEVHNWTIEQTTEWLSVSVDLPQYVTNFQHHRVNGATLPRLAVNNMHYLNNVLGIKDPIHKQKIALKAMDVVLFGPPKDSNSHWKDMTLVTLLFGSVIGCWYTYLQRKKSRNHLHRMLKDMESLHKAELALEDLQKELERAKLAQENASTEKLNLEKKLQEAGGDGGSLRTSYSDLEVSQLKAEIEVDKCSKTTSKGSSISHTSYTNLFRPRSGDKPRNFLISTAVKRPLILPHPQPYNKMLRTELQIAEGELKDRCWSPPLGLQQWLQLTHEIENKSYIKKKISAEKQLQQAREACEKLRKKRSSLVGAFVSTHGKSIDDVDRSIVEARTSLNEVTQELQERVYRWKQIEMLCGFNIINNNGLQYLESVLYRNVNGRPGSIKGRITSSTDDLDDETSSIYAPSATGCMDGVWKEPADSSGSEASKHDDDLSPTQERNLNNVHFIVGGETTNWVSDDFPALKSTLRAQSQQPLQLRSSNNSINNTNMVRSQSHETSIATAADPLQKTSQSDTNLDSSQAANKSSSRQKIIEEDVCSTDSSTVDEDVKRRRRKLFPAFSKKNKSKVAD